MASESSAWWSNHYSQYSIHDLSALPIHTKFLGMRYPFEREGKEKTESFRQEAGRDEYQWNTGDGKCGEKFGHDRGSDTWNYEHRFNESECHATVRSWLSSEAEWGEVDRVYQSFSVHEKWRLEGEVRNYERTTVQGEELRGLKTGCLPSQDGQEVWTETYWSRSNESEFEKVWERPGSSGGENKHNRGDYWWGEMWVTFPDHTEKKSWHTKGDRDWGHVHKEACEKVTDETWDISKTKRNEEKLIQDGDRRRGFRYLRDGADWYKQEWDGLALLGVEQDLELLKRAEMRQDLDEISANSHDTLLKGEHTIELLLRDVPQFSDEVSALKSERIAVPKPDSQDVNSLLSAIRTERLLADKQERLKQRMIDELRADHGKYYELHMLLEKLVRKSHETLKGIADVVGGEKVKKEWERWGEKIEEVEKKRGASSFGRDLASIETLTGLEDSKLTHISSLHGGIPLSEVSTAMSLLYQVMVKHDAVSDKIVELVPDEELKRKLDGFEDRFEELHKKFEDEEDPKLLHENLKLLLEYQPIHLHLMGRMRGYNKEEVASELTALSSAVESTKSQPSLKATRSKVRSGRPSKDTPFQLIDRSLNRLIPFLVKVNEVTRARNDLSNLLEIAKEKVDEGQPFEVVMMKAGMIVASAEEMEPKIAIHEDKLRSLDVSLTSQISSNIPILEGEDKARNEALLTRLYASEDVDLLQAKLSQTGGLVIETATTTMETEISGLKETIEELERIVECKGDDIVAITRVMDEQTRQAEVLRSEISDLKRYKKMFEDRDDQCSSLESANKKLSIDSSDLKLALDAANAQISDIETKIKDLEKFKQTAIDNELEISRLNGVIKSYEAMLGDRKVQFEVIIANLTAQIASLEAKIRNLEGQIEASQQAMLTKDEQRKRQLSLRLISIINMTLKAERFHTFLSWESRANEPSETLSESVLEKVPDVKPSTMDDEEEFSQEQIERLIEAEKPIVNVRKTALAGNVIFRHLRSTGLKFEPAMPLSEYSDLLEELLEKKLEADTHDLSAHHIPADFPSFVLDYLFHTKTVKRLAQRDLLRLIPTLYRLYSKKAPFGVAMARLLHMFNSSPAGIQAAVLAVRYSQLFRPLAEKYELDKEKRHVGHLTEVTKAYTGGEALLTDILTEFFPSLQGDDVSLWHFLRYIKPADCPIDEYILAVIRWFAESQKQISYTQAWEEIAGGKAEVSQEEFVTRVQAWGLHLSPRILKETFKAMEKGGYVNADIWGIRGEQLKAKGKDESAVTRGAFMLAVMEAVAARIRRNALLLRNQFLSSGQSSLSLSAFSELVLSWDRGISEETLTKMYGIATVESESAETVDIAGYAKVMSRYPAGELSRPPYQVPELLYLFDLHLFEFDLESGMKVTITKTTKITTIKTSTRMVIGKKS